MNEVTKLYSLICRYIKCDYCDKEVKSHWNSEELAEILRTRGWSVNRSAKVKCPDCVKKMKRK